MNRAGSVGKYTTKAGDRFWRFRFDVDPINGKRQMISKQGFETRAKATEAMKDAKEEHQAGKVLAPAPPPKETLADWLRAWLRDYAPQRCTPKTLERYWQLANYVLDAKEEGEPARLAASPLAEVDHVIVEAALYALLRMKAKRREHLSAKSVREIAGVLSVSLNKAFRMGKINVNPLLRVELPKVQRSQARSLTADEIQHLRDACRGDWTFPFAEISLATGARRGELLALQWSDIDWLNSSISISKSLEETKASLRVKTTKSEKPRKFRVGQTAITALRFLEDQQREYRRLYGADYQDHGLVFAEADGSYLTPHLVSQTIVRRMRKASIKDASLHTLRHTHASNLLSNRVPLPAVSARLGHADTNITARIYSHALPEDDQRAADTWETVITGRPQ